MKQRTSQWEDARRGKITASRVGAILGLSPFGDRESVMRDMVRGYHGVNSEFTGNIATEYGTSMEATAVAMFSLATGLEVEETGFHVHDNGWCGASPDGFVSDGAGLEVKVPFKGVRKSIDEQPHYMAQCQWNMFCTGRDKWHFYQWSAEKQTHDVIDYDKVWIDSVITELRKFYDEFLSELDNPEHLEPLRKDLTGSNRAKMLVDEIAQLREAKDNAEARAKELLEELVELAGDKNAIIGDSRLTKVTKKGSVSYAKAVKELLPNADLSKWTGKETSYWFLK